MHAVSHRQHGNIPNRGYRPAMWTRERADGGLFGFGFRPDLPRRTIRANRAVRARTPAKLAAWLIRDIPDRNFRVPTVIAARWHGRSMSGKEGRDEVHGVRWTLRLRQYARTILDDEHSVRGTHR